MTKAIVVPPVFAEYRIADSGAAGQRWVEALPRLVQRLCADWGLEVEGGQLLHGYLGLVVPVRRGRERYMLKVSSAEDTTAVEARALRAWGGRGAVRLLAARVEDGALLLERLDARRSLRDLDLLDAAEAAGALLRRLSVPAPSGFPALRDVATRIAQSLPARQVRLGHPVPPEWLDAACALAHDLGSRAGSYLVHGDLHYDNVLAGEREPWLTVDPKPVVGDPEYAIPELLWTRADDAGGEGGLRRLLGVLVGSGGLDTGIARGWATVRCVDYWLWGLEHGLTEDPVRCRRVLEAVAA